MLSQTRTRYRWRVRGEVIWWRFAVGHLPEPAPDAVAQPRTEVPEPTAEALRRAAELVAGIEDEELRNRVQRAVAFGLSKGPSDHRF